jgi:hypothetical protein
MNREDTYPRDKFENRPLGPTNLFNNVSAILVFRAREGGTENVFPEFIPQQACGYISNVDCGARETRRTVDRFPNRSSGFGERYKEQQNTQQ